MSNSWDDPITDLLVPVGSVIPWLPGYFTAAGNVGYTAVGVTLPGPWKECNGAALSAADSPILGGSGHYLPDVDDGRYLRGDTAANAGTPTAAASTGVLTSAEIPQHGHGVGTLATSATSHTHADNFSNGNEAAHTHAADTNTGVGNAAKFSRVGTTDSDNLSVGAGTSHTHAQNGTVTAEAAHTHAVSGSTGNYGTASPAAINPKYLNVRYIMRVR